MADKERAEPVPAVPEALRDYPLPDDWSANSWIAAADALRWAADRLDAEDQAVGLLAPGGMGFDAVRLRAWATELDNLEMPDRG